MSASTSSGHVPALALVRVVPILLQKSFCTGDQKFLNSLTTSVTRLRAHESAIVGRIFLQQKN
jgi:hypothetical protein